MSHEEHLAGKGEGRAPMHGQECKGPAVSPSLPQIQRCGRHLGARMVQPLLCQIWEVSVNSCPQGTQVSVQAQDFLWNMCGGRHARVL